MNNKLTFTVNNQSADSNYKGIILFHLSAWEGKKKSVPLNWRCQKRAASFWKCVLEVDLCVNTKGTRMSLALDL